MAYTHLLFGGIGTLVETSKQQLAAFNDAFAEHDIDFVWSRAVYADSLTQAGGKHRLRQITLGDGSALSEEQIDAVHESKTRIYQQAIKREGLSLRVGVADLLHKARAQDVHVAWVTTTSRKNLEAICDALGGEVSLGMFRYLGVDQDVADTKPAPDCYQAALAALGIEAGDALAIEDSPTGVAAARAAGIRVAAFPGEMHQDHDFSQADQIVIAANDLAPLLSD